MQLRGEGSSCVEFVELYRKNVVKHGLTPFWMDFGWAQESRLGFNISVPSILALILSAVPRVHMPFSLNASCFFSSYISNSLAKVQNKLLPTGTHISFITPHL